MSTAGGVIRLKWNAEQPTNVTVDGRGNVVTLWDNHKYSNSQWHEVADKIYLRLVYSSNPPIYNVSDRRLKYNIEVVGEMCGLKLYTWTWSEMAADIDPSLRGKGCGLIAQDVLPKYPSYVRDGTHGFMELDSRIYSDIDKLQQLTNTCLGTQR